jgi:hypothetical protein
MIAARSPDAVAISLFETDTVISAVSLGANEVFGALSVTPTSG